MSDNQSNQDRVIELITESSIAMLTYHEPSGKLVSKPMAKQETEFDGTVRFIAEKDSDKVQSLMADPRVNVSFSNRGSWVSVSGDANVVEDSAKLQELWGTFSDAWLEGGPDNPNNVLIEVNPDSAEYWGAPGGSTVVQLANLVKAKVAGDRIEGDNASVEL